MVWVFGVFRVFGVFGVDAVVGVVWVVRVVRAICLKNHPKFFTYYLTMPLRGWKERIT